MSADPRVSFIIGGVQKGGTTALFRYLEDIPSLAMSTVKETHFFDEEASVDWASPDYGAYHALFPAWDGRPRGEATPIYVYWPNCWERIARYRHPLPKPVPIRRRVMLVIVAERCVSEMRVPPVAL